MTTKSLLHSSLLDNQYYNSMLAGNPKYEVPARALWGGGSNTSNSFPVNTIQYLNITSGGENTSDFGDLTVARKSMGAGSTGTRAVWMAGDTYSPITTNRIDYVTIATTGNATTFGNVATQRRNAASMSNDTRMILGGGDNGGGRFNNIEYITMATTGNGTSFGTLVSGGTGYFSGIGGPTRGWFFGGYVSSSINMIQYSTFASGGTTTNSGSLLTASTAHGFTSNTRAIAVGDGTLTYDMQYFEQASGGNSVFFGDLVVSRNYGGGTSNGVRGVYGGGGANSTSVHIDTAIIATLGNATDFGDLLAATNSIHGATSDSHGGIPA
jgi:hypothetical protein